MIQAGTISSGSACTLRWPARTGCSSISRLRRTTLPGVSATSCPTRYASAPGEAGRGSRGPRLHQSGRPRGVRAPAAHRLAQYLGVREDEVRGGNGIEELAQRQTSRPCLVMPRHTADAGGRVVPPLLCEQEALIEIIERPALPIRIAEAPVLRKRFDTWRANRLVRGVTQTPAAPTCARPSPRPALACRATGRDA